MTDRRQLVERYLLGALTEEERAALERDYFEDRRLFEELVRVEHELVDDYARGRLSPALRERFEQDYLSHPARRERARFAEALATKIESTGEAAPAPRARPSRMHWLDVLRGRRLAWAAGLAALLLCAAAALLVLQSRRARPVSSIAEAERQAQERRAGEPQTQPAGAQPSPAEQPPAADNTGAPPQAAAAASPEPPPRPKAMPALVTLTLSATGTRSAGEGPSTLVIPAHTERVRLRLNVRDDDYASYAVVLTSAGGGQVFARRRLIPRAAGSGASLALDVPADRLRAGDYVLTLKGTGETGEAEDVSKFLIRVERR